jgi:hypothetical protein
MAGHFIERRRERRGDVDEMPRELEEVGEVHVDDMVESRRTVEDGLREALEDLAEQEEREERISQRLEKALEDLREMEGKKESIEIRLREALDSLEDEESGERKTEVSKGESAFEVKSDQETGVLDEVSEPEREVRESDSRQEEETAQTELSEYASDSKHSIEKVSPSEIIHNEIEDAHVRFGEIRNQEEFSQACERYSEIEYRSSYQTGLEEATAYFKGIENGNDSAKPDLVKELEHREIRRMYEVIHGGPPELKIESMKDVDGLLENHSEERDRAGFDERYRHCEIYFEIRGDYSLRREELAEKYNVGHSNAQKWRNGVEPTLIKNLRAHEEEKILREWYESGPQISEDILREFRARETRTPPDSSERHTGVHEVESQVIRKATEHLRDKKNFTVDDIVCTLEEIHQAAVEGRKNVRYVDLREALDSEKMREIERVIRGGKTELEQFLSEKIGLDEGRVRIAVDGSRVYTWIPRARPDELVDAYEKQFYYFKNHAELACVVEGLSRILGVEGNKRQSLKHLNEIIEQLVVGNSEASRAHPIENKSLRLEGKVIRLYLDVTDSRLSDLEGRVTKVTGINGQAGIENPRFPEGKQLEVLKARLAAIIASDCYLAESGRISYNEDRLERVPKVQEILQDFGDITLVPKLHHGVYESQIRNQIGLMMIHEGMTPGSKTIRNPGLPEGYTKWSEEARRAYLEELIPEEGHFSKRGGFEWNRNHALYDKDEGGKHHFKSVISPEDIQLIIDEGTQTKGLVPQYNLSYGKLEELQFNNDTNKSHSAKRLIEAIKNSPNNLVEDEKKIAESLGIQITLSPPTIRFYPKSERVSVRHSASTSTKNDAIRWGTICPPNDEYKRNKVEEWLREIAEDWLDKQEWTGWFE